MGIYSNETALNQRTGSYVASQVRVSDSHRGTDTAPRVSTSVSHSGDSVGQSHDQSQGQSQGSDQGKGQDVSGVHVSLPLTLSVKEMGLGLPSPILLGRGPHKTRSLKVSE